jgi:hypothetical protein
MVGVPLACSEVLVAHSCDGRIIEAGVVVVVAEGGADGTALPPTIGVRETAPDDGELLIPTGPAVFEPAAVIRATNPAAVTEESLLNTILMLASVDVTGAGRLLPLYEPSKRAVSDPS